MRAVLGQQVSVARAATMARGLVERYGAAVDVPGRIGDFLASPGRAERLAGDAGAALGALTELLRDEDLQPAVAALVDKRLRATPAAPAASPQHHAGPYENGAATGR